MTITVMLDWRDYCTAGVSILLVLSFQLAYRSREVAAGNNRRSMILFLWSGILLFVGHGILFVVAAFVSLEGLWIVNVAFMYQGTRAAVRLTLGLRRLRRESASKTPADDVSPAQPVGPVTNGHQAARASGRHQDPGEPWPRPAREPAAAALVAEATRTESLTPSAQRTNGSR